MKYQTIIHALLLSILAFAFCTAKADESKRVIQVKFTNELPKNIQDIRFEEPLIVEVTLTPYNSELDNE